MGTAAKQSPPRPFPATFRRITHELVSPTVRDGPQKLFTLVVLLGAYFSANLIFRWLRYTIFDWDGFSVAWLKPGTGVLLYQVYSTCLPTAVWGLLIYVAGLCFPRLLNRVTITFLAVMAVLAIDLDMGWYNMSERHVTWADAYVFLTQSWGDHFGIGRRT